MYLAPLNYDRFFKKVFSDEEIAKRFIEDFLDIKIDHIQQLPNKHKITDDAAAIEFDYRCKIGDQYIVVDMQQWYKPDLVKRFYLYHCVSSALQLGTMPNKSIPIGSEKKKTDKNYRSLEPVITIVWLVDETLGIDEDFIAYVLTPELLTEFVEKEEFWHSKSINEMLEQRAKVLNLINNRTKDVHFLAKNKLIFAFQKNIVKRDKVNAYVNWFKFAEKTKDENNTEADFVAYSDNKTFVEIMRRINKNALKTEDFTYITDFRVFAEDHKRWEEDVREEGREEGIEIGVEKGREKGREEGIEIGVEKGREEGVFSMIRNVIQRNSEMKDKQVADILGVSEDAVRQVRASL